MKLSAWLDATCPSTSGLAPEERDRRIAVRARVLKKAKTTIGTLYVARCRGFIGLKLCRRLADATKNEQEKILLTDEFNIKE